MNRSSVPIHLSAFLSVVMLVAGIAFATRIAAFQDRNETQKGRVVSRYAGKVPVPEFPAGMEWLNTDRPVLIKDLAGKVVLLDFWTYC